MKKLFAGIDRGVEYGVAAIFAAMCVVGLLQVFNRFVLNNSSPSRSLTGAARTCRWIRSRRCCRLEPLCSSIFS